MDFTTSNPSGKSSNSELQIDPAAVPVVFRIGPIHMRSHFVEIALRKLHQACLDSPWLQQAYDSPSRYEEFEFATPEGGKYSGKLSDFWSWKREVVLYIVSYMDADGETTATIDHEEVIRYSCEAKGEKEYFVYLSLYDDTPSVMDFFKFMVQTALDRFPNVEVRHMPLDESGYAKLHIPPFVDLGPSSTPVFDRDNVAAHTTEKATSGDVAHPPKTPTQSPRENERIKATAAHYGIMVLDKKQKVATDAMNTTAKTYRKYRRSGWLLSESDFKRITGQSLAQYWEAHAGV